MTNHNLLYNEVNFGVQYALRTGKWTLLVAPNKDVAKVAHNLMLGAAPDTSSCSGRTLVLPNKGRVSILSLTEASPPTKGSRVSVMFLGGDVVQQEDTSHMPRWRGLAHHVIDMFHTNDTAHQ